MTVLHFQTARFSLSFLTYKAVCLHNMQNKDKWEDIRARLRSQALCKNRLALALMCLHHPQKLVLTTICLLLLVLSPGEAAPPAFHAQTASMSASVQALLQDGHKVPRRSRTGRGRQGENEDRRVLFCLASRLNNTNNNVIMHL